MFDPEKVAHYQPLNWDTGMYPEPSDKSAQYVLATDYDQLLEIYRNLSTWADGRRDLPQGLWSDERYRQHAADQQDPRRGSTLDVEFRDYMGQRSNAGSGRS